MSARLRACWSASSSSSLRRLRRGAPLFQVQGLGDRIALGWAARAADWLINVQVGGKGVTLHAAATLATKVLLDRSSGRLATATRKFDRNYLSHAVEANVSSSGPGGTRARMQSLNKYLYLKIILLRRKPDHIRSGSR